MSSDNKQIEMSSYGTSSSSSSSRSSSSSSLPEFSASLDMLPSVADNYVSEKSDIIDSCAQSIKSILNEMLKGVDQVLDSETIEKNLALYMEVIQRDLDLLGNNKLALKDKEEIDLALGLFPTDLQKYIEVYYPSNCKFNKTIHILYSKLDDALAVDAHAHYVAYELENILDLLKGKNDLKPSKGNPYAIRFKAIEASLPMIEQLPTNLKVKIQELLDSIALKGPTVEEFIDATHANPEIFKKLNSLWAGTSDKKEDKKGVNKVLQTQGFFPSFNDNTTLDKEVGQEAALYSALDSEDAATTDDRQENPSSCIVS